MQFDRFGLPFNALAIGEPRAPESVTPILTALVQESTRANGKELLSHRAAASLTQACVRPLLPDQHSAIAP